MRTALILLELIALRATAIACDQAEFQSRFEMFDTADAVIVAKATAAVKDNKITLAVERVLHGKVDNTITLELTGSDCDPGFPAGKRMVVFVKAGRVHFDYRGVIVLRREPYVARLTAWGAAKDDTERARVLEAALADKGEVAIDARATLRSKPALAKLVKRPKTKSR